MANLSRSFRWDPFGEMQRLTDQVLRAWGEGEQRAFAPAVDIYEDTDAIYVRADLPGVNVDDLTISVENNILAISGERRLERADDRTGYHRIESVYGTFTRSFVLPESVNPEEVQADLSEGILTVKIPKKAEAAPRKVQVKHGEQPKQVAAPEVTTSSTQGQPTEGESKQAETKQGESKQAQPAEPAPAPKPEYGQSKQPAQVEPTSTKSGGQQPSEAQKK